MRMLFFCKVHHDYAKSLEDVSSVFGTVYLYGIRLDDQTCHLLLEVMLGQTSAGSPYETCMTLLSTAKSGGEM